MFKYGKPLSEVAYSLGISEIMRVRSRKNFSFIAYLLCIVPEIII